MPGGDVIGREPELGVLSAFLDRSAEGPAGFVIEGEPGIGKSTLWLRAVAAARERGLLVLLSRPAEAERGLAHVGLGDLFEDALAQVAPLLSTPRRRALEVALLREEAADDPVDHRALGVAVRDMLHLLSAGKPMLLAVDDVQWLDPSSSSALAFALRRLPASPVLVLLARRLVAGAERSGLEQALDAECVLDASEADARRLERDWVLAHVTRCRGLVAAARGDVSGAASLLEHAVTQHETVGDAFGRARALLATRSAWRSASSSGSARRPGSTRPAPSSAGSAGAPARRA